MGTPGVPLAISRETLVTALKKHSGNKTKAAKDLDITRHCLHQKVIEDPELVKLVSDLRHSRDIWLCDKAEDALEKALDSDIDINASLKSAFYVLNNKGNDRILYSERYDAYYCSFCNEWLDPKCIDPECFFCPNRPDRPLTSKKSTK